MARQGGRLRHAARRTPIRPGRSRPGLFLLIDTPALARPGRPEGAHRAVAGSGRQDYGHAVYGKGAISALFRRTRVALHRHHDECRGDLLRGTQDGRRTVARRSAQTLPDAPPHAGTRRRFYVARGDLRSRNRPMLAPNDAPGLSRRFVLEPRPGLVALRLHAFVFADRAGRISGDGDAQRRLLPGEYSAPYFGWRDSVGLRRAGKRAALALAGGHLSLRHSR